MTMQQNCARCGALFTSSAGRKQCSTRCRELSRQRKRTCLTCGVSFVSHSARSYCDEHRVAGKNGSQSTTPDHGMDPVAVNKYLDWRVRLETAPPWVRHPVAWDNVDRRA